MPTGTGTPTPGSGTQTPREDLPKDEKAKDGEVPGPSEMDVD